MKKFLLMIFVLKIVHTVSNAQINTLPLNSNQICACSGDNINFSSNTVFNTNNVFSAQLSDANGSFASPTIIGTLNSSMNNGTIAVTIPCNTPGGNGYRIRIVSSSPFIIGTDNGSNITIKPIIKIDNIILNPGDTVCYNTNADLTVVYSGGGANANINWSKNTGSGFTPLGWGQNPVSYFVNVPSTIIHCTVSNGCPAADTTFELVGLPSPTSTITTIPSPPALCFGDSIFICASGNYTFNWSNGMTNCSYITPSLNSTYYVTFSDSHGCTETASVSTTLTAHPILSVSTTPASASVCGTANATLCASGAPNMVWTGGVTNCVPFAPLTSNTYTVTGTSAAGCSTTATATLNVITPPTVSISLTPNTNTICQGDSLMLCATGNAALYVWNGGMNNCVPNASLGTGVYTVTAANPNCSTTATVSIIVNPIITPTCSLISNPNPASIGTNVTYSANILPSSVTNYQLRWYKNNTLLGVTNSPNNTYSTPISSLGDSVYAVLVPSGCYSVDSVVSNMIKPKYPEGLNNLDQIGVLIYPNPTYDDITLSNLQAGDAIELYDLIGKCVFKKTSDFSELKIQASNYATGLYLLKLTRSNKIYFKEIFKSSR